MELLNRKPKELLIEFVNSYRTTQNISIEKANLDIKNLIKYYGGDTEKRNRLIDLVNMENQWYNGLKNGEIDYSVYNDDYYFCDLWACWTIYSRKYLKGIIKNNSLDKENSIMSLFKDVNSVIDLGCGIGYTTASLKEIFQQANVYGTNLEGTKQWDFCKLMAEKYNFKLIPESNSLKNIDLIFASEYFEHILDPIKHLNEIIETLNPKYFIIANAFNTRSVGHFLEYKNNEDIIPQDKISKLFNETLYNKGYKKVKTKLWNNRPTIYIKDI